MSSASPSIPKRGVLAKSFVAVGLSSKMTNEQADHDFQAYQLRIGNRTPRRSATVSVMNENVACFGE